VRLPNDAIQRVKDAFEAVELGDPRRDRRVVQAVGKLAARPGASLPDAMGSEAELEGLYRLANNSYVTFDALFDVQAAACAERCRETKLVLVIHDTTTASFAHADPDEVGHLPTGAAGFQLHVSLAVDADQWRRPLGVLSAEPGFRAKRSGRGSRKRKVSGGETAKWKHRESERWWRGVEQSAARLVDVPHLHVADREGDSYSLLGQMMQAKLRFVVRNNHDRRARDPAAPEDDWSTLRVLIDSASGILERDVQLSGRKGSSRPRDQTSHRARDRRVARLRFSAQSVELRRPRYLKDLPESITVNVVHVEEIDPPDGEDGVEWTLFTTEPIDTAEQVAEIVDIYRTRWLIEEFNKALKTGCLYEQRQFESRHALLVLLAMSLPIASELLWLRSRARTEPNAPATDVLTQTQVEVLREVATRKLSKTPTVSEALLAIAALGGHQRNNGEPGWLVLHRGLRKLHAYEVGWRAALSSRASDPEAADL
jgi:hypothetical protein